MTVYRVDVEGVTVWTEERDSYEGLGVFPTELFKRPADTPDGEAHPPAAHLYIDDEVIGVQRSHGDEADLLAAAADQLESDGDHAAAFDVRLDVHAARAAAATALGDPLAAAQHRANRANAIVEAIATGDPALAAVITRKEG